MTEIKPDMSGKFASVVGSETTPEAKTPLPVTPESILAVVELCDKLAPDTAELSLDLRVVHLVNRAFAHAHQMAAGVVPIVNKDSPVEPIGYLHPTRGFFPSQETLDKSVNEAFAAGKEEGRHDLLQEQKEAVAPKKRSFFGSWF